MNQIKEINYFDEFRQSVLDAVNRLEAHTNGRIDTIHIANPFNCRFPAEASEIKISIEA